MAESSLGTVHTLHPAPATKSKKKRTKKTAFDLPAFVIAGEPVFTAGLTYLRKFPRLGPYVTALQLLAAAGKVYVGNTEQRKTIDQIKRLRKQMRALDANSAAYATLNTKLMRILDTL